MRAYAYYTEGLQLILEDAKIRKTLALNLYCNQSYINLLLKRFNKAKANTLLFLIYSKDKEQKSLDAKAYYHAGLAAYTLSNFIDAKSHFEAQEKLQPDNTYAKFNLRRIEMQLQEEATGLYNLKKAVNSLFKNQGRPDVASFNGHIEVRSSLGAGRSLFATRNIPLGDIVMYKKAFCIVQGYKPEACCTLICNIRDDTTIRIFPASL